MSDQRVLVGAWRLISWENRTADGQVSFPMGADAVGYLIYTDDGRFSVMISRRKRANFSSDDLLGGTFVAYAGRYTFDNHQVVHHVELSLFPNWVGSQQRRFAELSEDALTLTARPLLLAGELRVPYLVWERVHRLPQPD